MDVPEAPRADNHESDLKPIVSALRRIRARARRLLMVHRVAPALAVGVLAVFGMVLADYLLRLPAPIRWINLLLALFGVVWIYRTRVRPAWGFKPSLTDVALRLEESTPGAAGLRDLIASGVDFVERPDPRVQGLQAAMRAEVIERARGAFRHADAGAVLAPGRSRKMLASAVLAVALVTTVAGVFPAHSGIGLARFAMPWSGAAWPKRTEVRAGLVPEVHPLGRALPLRASLMKTNRDAGETRVTAHVRVDGEPWRQVRLSAQPASDGIEPYERLIEPGEVTGDEAELEYWFETADDRTPVRRVLLVRPPRIETAHATVKPPAYADTPDQPFVSGEVELGPGTDERALVEPVLAGSEIVLTLTLNKEIPEPAGAWLGKGLGGGLGNDEWMPQVSAGADGSQWTLRWRADESVRLEPAPSDEHGLTVAGRSVYSFDVTPDRAPTATVLEPARDRTVLPGAVVALLGEARDDVALDGLALESTVARRPVGSSGAPAEAAGDAAVLATAPEGDEPRRRLVRHEFDLSTLALTTGDEVWVHALASDTFELDGQRHDESRSARRTLRVIDEQTFVEQIRTELDGLRRTAMRLDEQQGELQDRLDRREPSAAVSRGQGQLTERIEAQRRLIERLNERVESNRLDDDVLEGLLRDLDGSVGSAGEASERAADQARRAESDAGARAEAQREQERVRDELGAIVDRLESGQDDWALRRALDRLIDAQERALEQTGELGQETIGREAGELTPEQRQRLAELAERQEALARQSEQAIERMRDRARELQQEDATQAQAMRRAAQRAEDGQASERQDEASERLEENQTAAAQQLQQQALEALQQAAGELDQAQQSRDEALSRALASVIDSIRVLILDQGREISLLEAGGEPGARAKGMIALHTNTLATADETRAQMREMRTVADRIEDAAERMERAIVALRASDPEPDSAVQSERESLEILEDALEQALELQQDAQERQAQEARRELKKEYTALLERQVELRDATAGYEPEGLSRRDRAELRALGESQAELQGDAVAMRERTEEMAEAKVFDFAHDRLETSLQAAATRLSTADPGRLTLHHQDSAARMLRSLIEALDDPEQDDDDFREMAGGGGGGGGSGGQEPPLIPPLAELRLLRAMQQEAYELTRLLDEAGEDEIVTLEAVGTLQDRLREQAVDALQRLTQPDQAAPDFDDGAPADVPPGIAPDDEAPEGAQEEPEL